ncbi:unnamed protein product [Allacma fusca]|uniref:Uncharacterized protein n=1 Tax=Allacma fusca TaxID=39272 RepID=A0A8J2KAV6_9HEXA|nr:unnamed protein product [Allacma fusca]
MMFRTEKGLWSGAEWKGNSGKLVGNEESRLNDGWRVGFICGKSPSSLSHPPTPQLPFSSLPSGVTRTVPIQEIQIVPVSQHQSRNTVEWRQNVQRHFTWWQSTNVNGTMWKLAVSQLVGWQSTVL